jgi:hypothetical protein
MTEKQGWNLEDKDDLLEFAWGILANINHGDWSKCDEEYVKTLILWRDAYFKLTQGYDKK